MSYDPIHGVPQSTPSTRGSLPPFVEAALFLGCGLLIGAGLTVYLMDNSLHQLLRRPDRLPDQLLSRMEQRLDLSAAQRDSAAQIIAVHFEEFDAIRQRFQPEIQARLDTLRDDIAAILEPEQRQVWETQFERIRVAWQLGPLVPRDASEPGVSTSGTAAATGY